MRQKLIVFTGAGISTESGIPAFRDSDGMCGKYDAMKLASVEGFEEDPQAVLDFYNVRRKNLLEVEPNHAHLNNMDLAEHIVRQSDIFVVIGTSLVVYPAANLVRYAPREIPKFLIDPNEVKGGVPDGFQHIKAKAVEGVDELVKVC